MMHDKWEWLNTSFFASIYSGVHFSMSARVSDLWYCQSFRINKLILFHWIHMKSELTEANNIFKVTIYMIFHGRVDRPAS